MKVRCIDVEGLEDWLTEGKIYNVITEKEDGYLFMDDVDDTCYWNKDWFEVVDEVDEDEMTDEEWKTVSEENQADKEKDDEVTGDSKWDTAGFFQE